MKILSIYIVIICLLSSNTFAQKATMSRIPKNAKVNQKKSDTIIDEVSNRIRTIKSYYVEENINQKFGGYTITYEVSNLSLIDMYDLGPNNTRVITPRYGEVKQLSNNQIETQKSLLKPTETSNQPLVKNKTEPIIIKELLKTYENEVVENSKTNKKQIYIYLIKTYERIAEKGYKSIEIFQKLGDAYFFDGNYAKAVKWYGELFKMTSSLDSEYYDRFAYSLTAIGEKDKADEIIKKCDQLYTIEK